MRACFSTAVRLRQQVKAISSLVASLLVLPIFWVAGGHLETTEQGVLWVAGWLFSSSIVLILIMAPFVLWREAQLAQTARQFDIITYAKLARLAARELGWNFTSGWEALDFRDCIQQACHAGVISIAAIPQAEAVNVDYRNQYFPIAIPREDWHRRSLRIWLEDATQQPNNADNWDVRISSLGQHVDEMYRDPQIHGPAEAIEWLRTRGGNFRGVSEASYELQQARRAARDPQS